MKVPREIEMNEVRHGDIIRVYYVNPVGSGDPNGVPVEITVSGAVSRVSSKGSPMLTTSDGKSEISARTYNGMNASRVEFLGRKKLPFKLESREYYLLFDGFFGRTPYRISVEGGNPVAYTNVPTGVKTDILGVSPREQWIGILKRVHDEGVFYGYTALEPVPFVGEEGVRYIARSRGTHDVRDRIFKYGVHEPSMEILTGIGRWHYPEKYIDPNQEHFDKMESLGIQFGDAYVDFKEFEYRVMEDGKVNVLPKYYSITVTVEEFVDGVMSGLLKRK